MKITPIQSYGLCHSKKGLKSTKNVTINSMTPVSNGQDTVSFKGKNWLKGFGIGSGFGLVALSIISGGLATPFALGAYAATMGTAGGMIGSIIDENERKEKEAEEERRKNNGK